VDLHALAHPDEAVPQAVGPGGALAVVAHLDLQLVGAVAHRHVRVAGVRVLERVRESLLDDAVRREIHCVR